MEYTGMSVKNITLKTQSDVVIKKILSVNGTVTLPNGTEALEPGQVLVSIDGGLNFVAADADDEPNGILCEALTATGEAEVLVIGIVKAKYLTGLEASHKPHLFNNRIILK